MKIAYLIEARREAEFFFLGIDVKIASLIEARRAVVL